jgi:hypothetical protein
MSETLETGAVTPIESQEPVAPAQESHEEPKQDVEQEPEKDPQTPKTYTQEDLDRIVKKVRSNTKYQTRKEVEAEVYRQVAMRQPEPQPQAKPADEAPLRESFDDYESFLEARTAWITKQAIKAERETERKQSAEQARATEAQQLQARYQESVEAARASMPDFDEVVESADIPITEHIRSALLDSDVAGKLTYHLAKHPEEVERISRLSPVAQIKAIAMLESSFSQPAKTTKAPAPIKPIGASSSSTKDPARMSMVDYREWRKTQGLR